MVPWQEDFQRVEEEAEMKVTEVDCQMAKEMEVRFEVMALDELEEQE